MLKRSEYSQGRFAPEFNLYAEAHEKNELGPAELLYACILENATTNTYISELINKQAPKTCQALSQVIKQ